MSGSRSCLRHSCFLVLFLCWMAGRVSITAHPLDNWTWRNPQPGGYGLYAITYGAGVYAGIGDNGTVATSIDGVNWLQGPPPTYNWLLDVVYGDGQFIAVGGSATILSSPD